MRIALFEQVDGHQRLGLVRDDHLVDITNWVGPLGCCPLASFIDRSARAGEPASGPQIPLSDVTWLPPALGASAPLCVGVNYGDHARSVAARAGQHSPPVQHANPAVFTRYWSSLVGHRQSIVRPRASGWLDFEGELVVVIGKHCRGVRRGEAADVIAGYTIGQEGSVRDWQRSAATPTAGKNFHRSGAMGPWMVTADELPDPAALRLTTSLNGEVMQDSGTSDLIVDVPGLIEHITTFMPLAPGDVIFTGTPGGCLADRGGGNWLKPGDVVSVSISGIGTLTNTVVDEAYPPTNKSPDAVAEQG